VRDPDAYGFDVESTIADTRALDRELVVVFLMSAGTGVSCSFSIRATGSPAGRWKW
jgi:hypothetical protein